MSQLIRIKQVAELSGIKEPTWRKWILQGRCPIRYRKSHGLLLFDKTDLNAWISSLPVVDGSSQMGDQEG